MVNIWIFFTLMGEPEFWGALSAVLILSYFIVRQKGPKELKDVYKRALLLFAISVLLSLSLTHAIKYAAMEERPCTVCTTDNAGSCNVFCLQSPSFPSGHSTAAFAAFTSLFLILQKKKRFLLLFIIPALVAVSRVMLGVHFWHDIAAGSLIGIAIPLIIHHIHERWWDF
ncbi:MAG: phosphatase PAP2 family protein [Candidatus Micrarchaeota archaeon]|nr:phosphatase PAP2 family protein [Candidatus Micrarchaeota archaeon]